MVKIDKELDLMEESLLKMGQRVVRMHEKVIDALSDANKEIALDIMKSDEIINHLEEEINDQAVRSLALLSPVASDLRKVVADIKIASELERIGDYAKNISIFLIKHEDIDKSILDYAQAMEKGFIAMLNETMECYANRDIDKAFEIPEQDKEINILYKELKEKLKQDHSSYLLDHIFEISSMLRNIERAGDHTKNICEHIIYMIKGQHYDFG